MAGIKLSLIDKQSDKILANCPDNWGELQYSSSGGHKVSAVSDLRSTWQDTRVSSYPGLVIQWSICRTWCSAGAGPVHCTQYEVKRWLLLRSQVSLEVSRGTEARHCHGPDTERPLSWDPQSDRDQWPGAWSESLMRLGTEGVWRISDALLAWQREEKRA